MLQIGVKSSRTVTTQHSAFQHFGISDQKFFFAIKSHQSMTSIYYLTQDTFIELFIKLEVKCLDKIIPQPVMDNI